MARGLKIDNKNSKVPDPPANRLEFLDKAAKEAAARLDDYKKRSWDLGLKFKAMIEDRVLSENRSPLSRDLEQEVLNKLSALASEINADEVQPEGTGGVALSQLLMKMMLLQRDTINNQGFKIDQLEKKLKELEESKK